MKKIIAIFCLLSIGLSSNAFELFPYKNSQEIKMIEGKFKTNGCNDIITIPSNSSFNLLNDLKNPTAVSVAGYGALAAMAVLDPYVVPIDGVNYVMVKDQNTGEWGEDDLLGIDDTRDNMFASLKKLNSDNDSSKITAAELKKADIRLVQLNKDGILLVNERNKDYPLSKIDYIDMLHLRTTANSDHTGVFGHFNVYLKTQNSKKKMVVGFITFDTHSNLKIMFEE